MVTVLTFFTVSVIKHRPKINLGKIVTIYSEGKSGQELRQKLKQKPWTGIGTNAEQWLWKMWLELLSCPSEGKAQIGRTDHLWEWSYGIIQRERKPHH